MEIRIGVVLCERGIEIPENTGELTSGGTRTSRGFNMETRSIHQAQFLMRKCKNLIRKSSVFVSSERLSPVRQVNLRVLRVSLVPSRLSLAPLLPILVVEVEKRQVDCLLGWGWAKQRRKDTEPASQPASRDGSQSLGPSRPRCWMGCCM